MRNLQQLPTPLNDQRCGLTSGFRPDDKGCKTLSAGLIHASWPAGPGWQLATTCVWAIRRLPAALSSKIRKGAQGLTARTVCAKRTRATQRVRLGKLVIGCGLGQSLEIESGIDRTDQVIVNPSDSVAGEDRVSGASEQRPARREASWPVDRSRRWQGGNKSLDGADTPVMLADQLFPRGMAQLRNGEYAPPWRRIVILHAWGATDDRTAP
jgi:hypothetical protein